MSVTLLNKQARLVIKLSKLYCATFWRHSKPLASCRSLSLLQSISIEVRNGTRSGYRFEHHWLEIVQIIVSQKWLKKSSSNFKSCSQSCLKMKDRRLGFFDLKLSNAYSEHLYFSFWKRKNNSQMQNTLNEFSTCSRTNVFSFCIRL